MPSKVEESDPSQVEVTGTSSVWQRWSFPALGYTLLPILLALRYIDSPQDPRTYGPSHWFLNYHYGFLRRALVGQVFARLTFLSWRNIFRIEVFVIAVAVALTYLVFKSLLFGTLNERRFAAFLLAAPAFLPHMSYMAGEMDNFLYISLLLGAWGLTRLPGYFGLLLATLLTCIGLAIHEGFLLMFYPLILALLVELMRRRTLKPLWVGLHCFVVAAVFFSILAFGKLTVPQSQLINEAQRRTDMPIESVVYLALHNSFSEQVRFAIGHYSYLLLRGIAFTLLLCIPYGVVLWQLLSSNVRPYGSSRLMQRGVLLIFLMPLLLIPLGHDAMRWIAALCVNVSLYVLFLYQMECRRGLRSEAVAALTRWNANPAIGATFVYLVALGPWGLAGYHFFANLGKH